LLEGGEMAALIQLASSIIRGLNVIAKPNVEPAFRKRRRELSSSCSMVMCILLS